MFLFVFGLRLLIAFSVFVERIRGNTKDLTQTGKTVLLAPILEPIPQATNSATIAIHGTAQPDTTLLLFLNGDEYKRIDIDTSGTFSVDAISLPAGTVTISARSTHSDGSVSDISNTITTIIDRTPPEIIITKPQDNDTINDGTNRAVVEGKTDPDAKVTVNDRIIIIRSDGSFNYTLPVQDGENTLRFVSTDPAGNSIEIERKITYVP